MPCTGHRSIVALLILSALGPAYAAGQTPSSAEASLLGLHESLLQAHRDGDVEGWMSIEADTVVSVNAGSVSFPGTAMRRAGREQYLGSTVFEVYADMRPPLVSVSNDGSLGWVIAQVRVVGQRTVADGPDQPIEDVWAWVELYRWRDGRWWLVGNVSNRRPSEPDTPGGT